MITTSNTPINISQAQVFKLSTQRLLMSFAFKLATFVAGCIITATSMDDSGPILLLGGAILVPHHIANMLRRPRFEVAPNGLRHITILRSRSIPWSQVGDVVVNEDTDRKAFSPESFTVTVYPYAPDMPIDFDPLIYATVPGDITMFKNVVTQMGQAYGAATFELIDGASLDACDEEQDV